MPRRNFSTVSDELIEYADEAATYFEKRGYRVGVEVFRPGFPYTPTLLCERQRTSIIIELFEEIPFDRILKWKMYARSTGKDTRVAVCLSKDAVVASEHEVILVDQGVGLYIATGNGVIERIPPTDLALGVRLPPLDALPRKLRILLGPVYEQFSRSNWREGFGDACQAFENEARKYLKAGVRRGRITLITRRGPKTITAGEIDRMTMGQLAKTFTQIQNQNLADAAIGKALVSVNPDRVGEAHHKSKAKTEQRLRANVEQHMWTIVSAMKEML